MITISQSVREILERSPFLQEILSEGIANASQIARRIRPDVEKRLYEKVSEASVAMAIHRLSKELKRPNFGTKFLKRMSDITVRSGLVEFSFPNATEALKPLDAVSKNAHRHKDTFFTLSRGLHETVLIVNAEFANEAYQALKHVRGLERIDNLSAITLHLPEDSLNVPGVYYPILSAIAHEGISFVEVMSVRTEFSILFKDKDVDRAFSVLKRITS